MITIYELTLDDILQLHKQVIRIFGGSYEILDQGLLEYLSVAPYQNIFGEELYPDIFDKAVKYLFGFAQHQVFQDGNKRVAAVACIALLRSNGICIKLKNMELYEMTLKVANNEMTEVEVKDYLIKHSTF